MTNMSGRNVRPTPSGRTRAIAIMVMKQAFQLIVKPSCRGDSYDPRGVGTSPSTPRAEVLSGDFSRRL